MRICLFLIALSLFGLLAVSVPETNADESIDISHQVELFPQPTNCSCWSAAATMLFGNLSAGAGSAQVDECGALKADFENIEKFAKAYNLVMHAPQSWSIEGLANLLKKGPLWVGGEVPAGHAFVISAIKGDGSSENTNITIYDPLPVNKGKILTINYSKLMNQYPMATTYILQR